MKILSKDHFGGNLYGKDQQILRDSKSQGYNFHNDIKVVQSNIAHFKSLLAQVEAGLHIQLAKCVGLDKEELKDHLTREYKQKIKHNQYNLVNILFSEN